MKESLDVSLMSAHEAAQYVVQAELSQLGHIIPLLSEDQILVILAKLTPEHDIQWAAKLLVLFHGLNERARLQVLGTGLNAQQMLTILDKSAEVDYLQRDKLQFVLITLPQIVFEDVLLMADKEARQVLKGLGGTECLQHHLTLLIHQLAQGLEGGMKDLQWLKQKMETYDVKNLLQEELDQFVTQLSHASEYLEYHLALINLGLELAWNTTRRDFLEHLMILKDDCLQLIRQVVGHPADDTRPDTGLYLVLQQRLCSLFGEENGFSGLEDDAPSLEALAAFSLWVIQDYWEVGLLPGITSKERLQLNPESHTETEQEQYIVQLTAHVQNNLKAIGLGTVGDLKRSHVFSKHMLTRHIEQHKAWLMPFVMPS